MTGAGVARVCGLLAGIGALGVAWLQGGIGAAQVAMFLDRVDAEVAPRMAAQVEAAHLMAALAMGLLALAVLFAAARRQAWLFAGAAALAAYAGAYAVVFAVQVSDWRVALLPPEVLILAGIAALAALAAGLSRAAAARP